MNIDNTSTRFERCFDEESGKTIKATSCPSCGGEVRVDGGEIECLACEIVLNEYARTGRVPKRAGQADSPGVVS